MGPGPPRDWGAQPAGKTHTHTDCDESFSLKALFLLSKQALIQLYESCQLASSVSPVTTPQQEGAVQWHLVVWAWSSGWTLVSSHKPAQFNAFIYKKNYSASFKFHVIPLNPITEIIIFPFSFSKVEEGYLGTWFLFRVNLSSVRNKNSVTG